MGGRCRKAPSFKRAPAQDFPLAITTHSSWLFAYAVSAISGKYSAYMWYFK